MALASPHEVAFCKSSRAQSHSDVDSNTLVEAPKVTALTRKFHGPHCKPLKSSNARCHSAAAHELIPLLYPIRSGFKLCACIPARRWWASGHWALQELMTELKEITSAWLHLSVVSMAKVDVQRFAFCPALLAAFKATPAWSPWIASMSKVPSACCQCVACSQAPMQAL